LTLLELAGPDARQRSAARISAAYISFRTARLPERVRDHLGAPPLLTKQPLQKPANSAWISRVDSPRVSISTAGASSSAVRLRTISRTAERSGERFRAGESAVRGHSLGTRDGGYCSQVKAADKCLQMPGLR